MGFLRTVAIPFHDPTWPAKIVLGGVLTLLCLLGVGIPIVVAYVLRYFQQNIEGEALPLPDWDLPALLREGLEPSFVLFLYHLPLLALLLLYVFVHSILPSLVVTFFFVLLALAFLLLISALLPVAFYRMIREGSWSTAFDLQEIIGYISDIKGEYLKIWLMSLLIGVLGWSGGLFCFVGAFFTLFVAWLVNAHLFAQIFLQSVQTRESSRFQSLPRGISL